MTDPSPAALWQRAEDERAEKGLSRDWRTQRYRELMVEAGYIVKIQGKREPLDCGYDG